MLPVGHMRPLREIFAALGKIVASEMEFKESKVISIYRTNYMDADKSLARAGMKQANVSVRMA
jgi:hypothetical protein